MSHQAQIQVLLIKSEYHFRWGILSLAALLIILGAVMTFMGLQGSFDWAVQGSHAITAKITNASPGIAFATIGMVLALTVTLRSANIKTV